MSDEPGWREVRKDAVKGATNRTAGQSLCSLRLQAGKKRLLALSQLIAAAVLTEQCGDVGVTLRLGHRNRRLAIVGVRVWVGTVGEKQRDNLRLAAGRGFVQRRVVGSVAVISVRSGGQKGGGNLRVAARHRSGQSRVTRGIARDSVYVRAVPEKRIHHFQVAEESCETKQREANRGVSVGEARVSRQQRQHALHFARGRRFKNV